MAMLDKVILENKNSKLIFEKTFIRPNWHDQNNDEIVDETLIRSLDNAFTGQTIAVNGQDYIARISRGGPR